MRFSVVDNIGATNHRLLDRLRNHFSYARASTSCNFQAKKITIPTSFYYMVYASTEELERIKKLRKGVTHRTRKR